MSSISTPHQPLRIFLQAVAVASVLVGVGLWVTHHGSEPLTMILALLGASLIYGGYSAVSFAVYTERHPRTGQDPKADPAAVRPLLDALASGQENYVGLFYFQMIMDPARNTLRITDRIRPTTRAYEFTRTLNIGLPEGLHHGFHPIPIGLISKRNLANRLSVRGPGEKTYATLTQDATIAHSAVALRQFVVQIGHGRLVTGYEAELEHDVLSFLCRNEEISLDDQDLRNLASRLMDLSNRQRERDQLRIAVTFLQLLATHYPLVVYADCGADRLYARELATSCFLRLIVRRNIIPVMGTGITFGDKLRDAIRLPFGIRPNQIDWDLSQAALSRSYHLECLGPEGSYLTRQRVYIKDEGKTRNALGLLNFKLLPRHGQRFAHVYVHDYRPQGVRSGAGNGASLRYTASFFERPPGSIAAAAISAFTAAVLITIAAVSRLRLDLELPTDIVVVLLTLPAVASAWMGFTGGQSIFLGSLGARLSLVASLAVSLLASALFLLGPIPDSHEASIPWDQRSGATVWILLGTATWLNVIGASLSFLLRVATYRHFVHRARVAQD